MLTAKSRRAAIWLPFSCVVQSFVDNCRPLFLSFRFPHISKQGHRILFQGSDADQGQVFIVFAVPFLIHSTVTRELKRLPAYFYRSDSGREPVREWLKSLKPADRKIIGEDIKDVEFSWPLGMPLVRSLGHGLWEVRSNLSGSRIARVIFCVDEGRLVLLHGFIKKSRKTPKQDIELALRRKQGERP